MDGYYLYFNKNIPLDVLPAITLPWHVRLYFWPCPDTRRDPCSLSCKDESTETSILSGIYLILWQYSNNQQTIMVSASIYCMSRHSCVTTTNHNTQLFVAFPDLKLTLIKRHLQLFETKRYQQTAFSSPSKCFSEFQVIAARPWISILWIWDVTFVGHQTIRGSSQ